MNPVKGRDGVFEFINLRGPFPPAPSQSRDGVLNISSLPHVSIKVSVWLAIFLGLTQGLTEFLPVSSSGHLIMFQHLFGTEGNNLLFNIVLHLATLCAVLFVFRVKIFVLIRRPFNKTNYCLLVSTLVTCTLVVLFKDFIDKTFNYKILPVTFLITAIILFIAGTLKPKNRPISYPAALVVGFTQGIAVIPGLSRSGVTISTMLCTGTKRELAAEYSFLMSVPIIIASFLYELISAGGDFKLEIAPTAAAFVAALLSGIFAVKIMLQVIRNVRLHWFSFYLVALAVVCLVVM